jgi:hypothetical protein
MTIRPELKTQIRDHLLKSRAHLETSFKKVQSIKIQSNQPEEELETLESFSSRFARFSDLAVSKYFRMLALEQDPAYRGTPIDLLNLAEKMGWIDSAMDWKRIRELRNVAAHEYVANDAVALYQELVRLTPILLSLNVRS